MARSRLRGLLLAAVLVAVVAAPFGLSQNQPAPPASVILRPAPQPGDGLSTKVYRLGDAELGKWLTETIPQAVEPDSWQPCGGPGVLSFFAPSKALVVRQTSAVQAKVEAFLGEVTAATSEKAAPNAVPVATVVPATAEAAAAVPAEPMPYPVAPAVRQPKHLFHFIIRYEGDGLIDSNVVEYLKLQAKGASPDALSSALAAPVMAYGSAAPAILPCPPVAGSSPPPPPPFGTDAPNPGTGPVSTAPPIVPASVRAMPPADAPELAPQ